MNFIENIQHWMKNSVVDEIIILAIFIAIIESLAQNTLKRSDQGSYQFLLGIFIYTIVGYTLHYAYHKFPLGKLNVLWSCISIILAMTLGFLLYDEQIDNWAIMSVIFAIIAVGCSYMSN